MLPGWHSTQIAGHPADYFEPLESPARFALIYLHGAGQETLADKPVYTQWLRDLGFPCVCPRGDQAWWADRICSTFDPQITAERFIVDHVRRWVMETWSVGPRGVGLFGISMGGQGALRIAFRHASQFPVVAGVSPAIEYHCRYGQGSPIDDMYSSKEQCRQDTAIMHIPPTDSPPHIFFCCDPDDLEWHRGNDRLHEKLMALGVSHECDLTTQAGAHSWDYYDHVAARVFQFLRSGLEHESRRLL
jgi:S-formylglutathione hydrolase